MQFELDSQVLPLAVALGVGLLIGTERERRKREDPSHHGAGVRSFALAALAGTLAMQFGQSSLLAVVVAGIALLNVIDRSRRHDDDAGLTTEIALIVTVMLGALAIHQPALAAAIAVVVAGLLAARTRIHHFAQRALTDDEVNDALLLGAAALVVLPLMPDRYVGPLQALNPRSIWLLVVLIMSIGAAGHIARRAFGNRIGLPVAGFISGFVSSAATIGSMGALARKHPHLLPSATGAAMLSNIATIVQLSIIIAALSRPTVIAMAPSLVLAGAAALFCGALSLWRTRTGGAEAEPVSSHAFSMPLAIGLAIMIGGVLLAAALLQRWLGTTGIVIATGLAGFADTHSAAASTASLVANGRLDADAAVIPVLTGLSTNTLTKLGMAWTAGGWPFLRKLAPGLLLICAAAWAGLLI